LGKYGLDKDLADDANFVAIVHKDQTYDEYLHLGKDSVVVTTGQKVSRGDVLGYTGLPGCMSAPHLHLNVFKTKGGKAVSIPISLSR